MHENATGDPATQKGARPVGGDETPAPFGGRDDAADERPRRPGRRRPTASEVWNPHVVILVVGGLVLVAIGVRLYRSALAVVYSDFASRRSGGLVESDATSVDAAEQLVSMQVEWTVGPLLIAFGVAAVLLAIVVLAVRWPRRNGGR